MPPRITKPTRGNNVFSGILTPVLPGNQVFSSALNPISLTSSKTVFGSEFHEILKPNRDTAVVAMTVLTLKGK
jgi:hypothetical protein